MNDEKNKYKVEEHDVSYEKPLNFNDVWKMFQETNEQMKETDKKMQETDKKIKELSALFTSQWGKLIESLVEGDLVRMLNDRDIAVQDTTQRRRGNYKGKSYEFDIIAKNSKEIVVVEVKTTLRPDDINEFLYKLDHVKTWLSEYRENILYGAVAFLVEDAGSAKMAENRGLFVIKATGDSASIINTTDFEPSVF